MASTNKTEKLGLNSWLETDKPRRADFVEDNAIIDDKLGNHLVDDTRHFTTEDREKLANMVYTESYGGDGKSSRSFTLPFEPSFVIVYNRYDTLSYYDPELGYNLLNAAVFAIKKSLDFAGSLDGAVLTVNQSTEPETGLFANLNRQFAQYVIIAVR